MGSKENIQLDRYLIETPHTAQECQQLFDQLHAMGYLHHFDWGCRSGVHSGWAIIDAESESQARLAVPSLIRRKARVVKIERYDGKEEEFIHDA
jgi:hypothetical protein